MKPVRRLVTLDGPDGRSRALADGPAPEVRADGVVSSFIWATDRTPARVASEPARVADTFAPLRGGSVCRIATFPPDGAARPPMRKTRTLDFCVVLEGEITLVLDLEEVSLRAGDVVVQRATRHAWSNRSGRACVVAISSHDAAEEPARAGAAEEPRRA
jgi:quercetin dioxygenase-like cupin family protein